ncbi:MAG: EAL domain-containing protein [Treponema sp.]|nr:EAL domain-containing protein [Treponema sp.]
MKQFSFALKAFARCLVLGLTIFSSATVSARTIRVPSLETYKFLSNDPPRSLRMYYSDYLSLLAQRCDWQYEYVDLGYADSAAEANETALKLLNEGKLDLIFDVIEQDSPAKLFYSSIPSVTKHIILVESYKESDFNNANLKRMAGATASASPDSPFQQRLLEEFSARNGLNLRVVLLPLGRYIEEEFIKNGIEACTQTLSFPVEEQKIIQKLGEYRVFFASRDKGIIQALDKGVSEILREDPLRFATMMAGPNRGQAFYLGNPSEQEIAYIKEHSPVHVLENNIGDDLTELLNVKNEFWKKVSSISGMEFVVDSVKRPDNTEFLPGISEIPQPVTSDSKKGGMGLRCTNAFYSVNAVLICAPGHTIEEFTTSLQRKQGVEITESIAIPLDMMNIVPFFRERFISFDAKPMKSVEECLRAIATGKCNAAIINHTYLDHLFKLGRFKSLQKQQKAVYDVPMCIYVSLDRPDVMISILNRAFAQFPYNYYNKLSEQQALYARDLLSRQRNRSIMVSSLSGILILFVICVLFVVIYHIKKLRHKMEYDDLTKIHSLNGFEKATGKMLRYKKGNFLLTELNVRDFSFINRIYGTEKGDKILISIAKQIMQCYGKHKDTVLGRGYADNFYIFQRIQDKESSCLNNMESEISLMQDMIGKSENIHLVIKSGNAVSDGSESLKILISRAGYARKSNHDSMVENFSVYNEQLKAQRENEEFIENNIEEALKNEEFMVYYQPKTCLDKQTICGAEALVRWKSKDGLVPPDRFIPVLEKNGLVGKLDNYVYETVFKYMNRLMSENVPLVPVSLNISRLNYNLKAFIENLNSLVKKYGIPKRYIELEIEERFAGANDDFIKDFIERLHREDFKVSMDDFGSGSSSLNMLSEIPVDIIKFDQRFLHHAEYSQASRIVLTSMIKMVHNLGKLTVCEGVETEKHVELLRSVGCNVAQGYYYSKPLNERDFKYYILTH